MTRTRKAGSVRYASSQEVVNLLDDMPDEYLDCREGHAFVKAGTQWDQSRGRFVRVRHCTRCKTRKTQEIGPDGSFIATRYVYPDGYLISGIGRLSGSGRDTVRLFNIQREMGGANVPVSVTPIATRRRKQER